MDKRGLEPGLKPSDVVIGLRLIGQRALPDAAAFQDLVYDCVTFYKGRGKPFTMAVINQKKVRGFPRGYDLFAALGSDRAYEQLRKGDDINYEGYGRMLGDARYKLMRGMEYQSWYSDTLKVMRYLAQRDKVDTAFGFWIQARYNRMLYAKQSYTIAEKGLGAISAPSRHSAYLEPFTDLYFFMSQTVKNRAPYLSPNLKQKAESFAAILDTLGSISFKENLRLNLTSDEVEFLNSLDLKFKNLFGKDSPIVVDVHTEPTTKKVLEEAIGKPFECTIDINGQQYRGARYSVYEFKQDMSNRLDDNKWLKAMDKYKPLTIPDCF